MNGTGVSVETFPRIVVIGSPVYDAIHPNYVRSGPKDNGLSYQKLFSSKNFPSLLESRKLIM